MKSMHLSSKIDWAELPPAPESDPITKTPCSDLGAMVCTAVGENPVARPSAISQIEKLLSKGVPLPVYQIRNLSYYSQEGPNVNREHSFRLQLAIFCHMALHGHAAAWPDGWAMVKARLERVLTNHWETVSLSLERADFLRKFEKETALVLDICDLRDLTVAIGNKTPFPVPQLNVLLKFHLGKLFYQKGSPSCTVAALYSRSCKIASRFAPRRLGRRSRPII